MYKNILESKSEFQNEKLQTTKNIAQIQTSNMNLADEILFAYHYSSASSKVSGPVKVKFSQACIQL